MKARLMRINKDLHYTWYLKILSNCARLEPLVRYLFLYESAPPNFLPFPLPQKMLSPTIFSLHKSERSFFPPLNYIISSPSVKVPGNNKNLLTYFVSPIETLIVFRGEGDQHKTRTAKKLFAWRRLAHKFAPISRSTTWSRASRKFLLSFP